MTICLCKVIFLMHTTVTAYRVTDEGLACTGENLIDLDHEQECKDAIPMIQDAIPDSSFVMSGSKLYRPKGCYFSGGNVFWNSHRTGGDCLTCRSICKGKRNKSKLL